MELHPRQRKLIEFLKNIDDLQDYSYWDIARETGLLNAQTVIHHMKQLEKLGYLRRDPSDPDNFELLKDPIDDVVYLHLYGFAQCGNKAEFFSEENQREKIAIPTAFFGISKPDDCFVIKAKGDSMSPKILEDDLVIFREQKIVEDGSIALVIHNEECKIKQIFYTTKGTLLKSFNHTHEDVLVKNENIEVLGLARQVIHHL